MRNKKGFTLIELLVVIALMLSILGIAVVSLINTSNKKKKESWEQVKEQIETAAVEYFTVNEYLFEGLKSDSKGVISVGKLVSEDYLNKVTNPDTGKAVSMCAIVNIEKKGERYSASFDESTQDSDKTDCEQDNSITIIEPGSPIGEIFYFNENNASVSSSNGWFNIQKLGENKPLNVCIKVTNPQNSGHIINAKLLNKEAEKKGDFYCTNVKEDGKYERVTASLINSSGKIWKKIFDIKKDTQKPEGIINIVSSTKTYNSNVTNVNINVKDNLKRFSNIIINNKSYSNFSEENVMKGYDKILVQNNFKISNGLDGKTYNINAKVYDEAGNEGEISEKYIVYKECDNNITNNYSYNDSCGDKGYRNFVKTNKDKYTGKVCLNEKGKEDCQVKSIIFALNYNQGDARSNPGMRGVGPLSSNGNGRIFRKDPSGQEYSVSKRGMNITVGWNNNGVNMDDCYPFSNMNCTVTDAGYAASSCMYVGDFERRFIFRVRWSDGTQSDRKYIKLGTNEENNNIPYHQEKYFSNRKSTFWISVEEDLRKKSVRYDCTDNGNINVERCGNSSGSYSNVTKHVYFLDYQRKIKSNTVSLYTKYFINCR